MILVIDNYDSFTYIYYQYINELMPGKCLVERNDGISVEAIKKLNPDKIIISPGPCTPDESGVSMEVIDVFQGVIPVLGICLGHQCIAQYYKGRVLKDASPVHGKTSNIVHSGKGVFEALPSPFAATRYHSLVVEKETLPSELEVTATTEDGLIMGLRHKELPVEGVQFHPESVMTEYGKLLLQNFLQRN